MGGQYSKVVTGDQRFGARLRAENPYHTIITTGDTSMSSDAITRNPDNSSETLNEAELKRVTEGATTKMLGDATPSGGAGTKNPAQIPSQCHIDDTGRLVLNGQQSPYYPFYAPLVCAPPPFIHNSGG